MPRRVVHFLGPVAIRRCGVGCRSARLVGVAVIDLVFVLVTLVVFGLLALAAKGAEKL